jgi:metal-dependent hydrolase (beta-lactamase superfamily II)
MAEHGFSALVTVRRGDTTTSVLFDTGLSPDAMVTNADRLGLDLSGVHAVVLSHGHFDHAGGLAGLAGRRGIRSLPMVVHPLVWTRRRLALPGGGADDWPTLSKRALTGEGFDVIERRQPSLLVDGSILITGEVDRTTDFEHGMPPAHQHWTGAMWEPDPLILDDQALVVNVRGLAPDLLVPGHCTGWRAQHTLAAALPDSWIQSSSGTRYQLTSSLPVVMAVRGPKAQALAAEVADTVTFATVPGESRSVVARLARDFQTIRDVELALHGSVVGGNRAPFMAKDTRVAELLEVSGGRCGCCSIVRTSAGTVSCYPCCCAE